MIGTTMAGRSVLIGEVLGKGPMIARVICWRAIEIGRSQNDARSAGGRSGKS